MQDPGQNQSICEDEYNSLISAQISWRSLVYLVKIRGEKTLVQSEISVVLGKFKPWNQTGKKASNRCNLPIGNEKFVVLNKRPSPRLAHTDAPSPPAMHHAGPDAQHNVQRWYGVQQLISSPHNGLDGCVWLSSHSWDFQTWA